MAQFLSMAFLGFFLGMRHATDPDHVVAVTTTVSRERRVDRVGGIGMLWGLGHTVMMVVLGMLSLVHRLDGHRHTGDLTPETKGEHWFVSRHQSLRPLAIGVV